VADKTPLLVIVRDRLGSPFAVDKVTLSGSAPQTAPPFSFDLLAAGKLTLTVEKANHHTYVFTLDVRETGNNFTVDFHSDMIDAPRMAHLVKASASTTSKEGAKNVLTLSIGAVHEVLMVSGYDYRPHVPSYPLGTEAKYRAFASQRMHDLYASGLIDDSTVISFFELQTAELTRWVRGRGKERVSDFYFTSGWSRLSRHAGSPPILPKGATGYPGLRKDDGTGIKTIVDIYQHIEEIGRTRPGALQELSFFSHSDRPGPVLFNTFEDKTKYTQGKPLQAFRDPADADPRFYKDFRDQNMPPATRAQFVAAFSSSPFIRVWGCLADSRVKDMVRKAAQATSDTQTLNSNLQVRTLWFPPHDVYPDTRLGAIDALKKSLFEASYMRGLAQVIGHPVTGAAPGTGSNILNTAFGARFYIPEFELSIVNGQEVPGAAVYKLEIDFLKSRLNWTFEDHAYMRYDP